MSQPSPVHTPEVLASLANELEHAGELCDRLEVLVTQLVRFSRGEPLQIALHEAQTLDVLTQHLAALALFTRKLSSQAHSGQYDLTAAVASVTLGDLAMRLAKVTPDSEALVAAPSGDLDLF
jgi:phosphoglycerate-specific signal transduction histidine kinase